MVVMAARCPTPTHLSPPPSSTHTVHSHFLRAPPRLQHYPHLLHYYALLSFSKISPPFVCSFLQQNMRNPNIRGSRRNVVLFIWLSFWRMYERIGLDRNCGFCFSPKSLEGKTSYVDLKIVACRIMCFEGMFYSSFSGLVTGGVRTKIVCLIFVKKMS